MNESVGYTVTINIIITFIIIVFVFLSNVLIYYKSNKVGNVIVDSIEKYSGFNDLAKKDIEKNLSNIGYNKTRIRCDDTVTANKALGDYKKNCTIVDKVNTEPNGYCVYYCVASTKKDSEGKMVDEYYYYKVKANMIINIPIINDIVNGSVFSSTENMYNFEGVSTPAPLNPNTGATSQNIIYGDVDGDGELTTIDAVFIQRYIEGINDSNFNRELADFDGNGEINNDDALAIRNKLAERRY